MTDPLARRERRDLCDLALAVGPDAPTLCAGWDATDLVTHLLVRERNPVAAAGIAVAPLSGLTERAMARLRRRDFSVLVERLRSPGLSIYALPPVERVANTLEYVVHHEDLRRAQPDWQPRELDPRDADLVWSLLRGGSSLLGRRLPVPVVIRRSDSGATATLRRGEDPVVVSGPVTELLLFLYGRDQVRDLAFQGPPDRVARLQGSSRGL